jgi:diaminohydroxyphosphoribosylaminopyrimidine deaminase/5-amino-6-(5-phosphoribosylamino)uracil reductase
VTSTDTMHMARALALAERGRGRTSPNPMVGAVVVDDEGVVIGRGAHQVAGGPHAEVHALADAGERARRATLYCTLEPCSHTGRTGPCAPRVVEAGIRRAVVAVEDPNPLVAGKGLAYLREHGVDVSVGVLGKAAERLNAPFFTVMRRCRPFVTMKVALSRDGRVAARAGARTELTGAAANRLIHRERAEVDAIAVGSGTVLIDDPLLTARGAYRTRALVRVVFDRTLRTPPSARMLSTLDAGPIIVVTAEPRDEGARRRSQALVAAGAQVELVSDAGGAFVTNALAALARLGICSLILEGGPTLHAAAWVARVVDRVQIFRTPCILGDDGVPWLNGAAQFALHDLQDVKSVQLGADVMIEGDVHRID